MTTYTIQTKIINVKDLLLRCNLSIPSYQRPYKWTIKNVNQLIDDIIIHQEKSAYRLGTLVVHQEDKNGLEIQNIVDGQQRSITLSLIAFAINQNCREIILKHEEYKTIDFNTLGLLSIVEFQNEISLYNIQNNYNEIVRRVRAFDKKLIEFFFEKCELVQIVLNDISEAFQFFDSQNARGKDLKPHDLLKAFHLREMKNETEAEKIKSVTHWESLDGKELATLFENYLFRIRNWSKGYSARYFTKNEVDVFKGISFDNKDNYPYMQLYRIGHYFTEKYNSDYQRNIDLQQANFPFQIDQVIINGKRFFEMVAHYKYMIDKINLNKVTTDVKILEKTILEQNTIYQNIIQTISTYEGRNRTGDGYVRTLFDCAMIHYLDKFEEKNIEMVFEKIFIWAYSLRLQLQAVQIASMDNHALQNNIFKTINEALHPSEVMNFSINSIDKNNSTKTEAIFDLFNTLHYVR